MMISVLDNSTWVVQFDSRPTLSSYEFKAMLRDLKAIPVRKRYMPENRNWRLYLPLSATGAECIHAFIHTHGVRYDRKVIDHITSVIEQARREQQNRKLADFLKEEGAEEHHDIEIKYKTKPWGHQVRAVEFCRRLNASLIYGGMGIGKTKIAIDLIQNTGARNVLVICPKTAMSVWPDQLAIHSDMDYRCSVLNQASNKIKSLVLTVVACSLNKDITDITVINYDSIWRGELGEQILGMEFDLVIADEVHRIKSAGSRISRYMARLAINAKRRVGLSGTPLSQGPMDAYGSFRFLDRNIFGTSFQKFRDRYAVMGGFQGYQIIGYQNEEEFAEKFGSITIEISSDILDLPEQVDIDVPVQMPLKAQNIYKSMQKDFVAYLDENTVITAANALSKLTRLQQITSGFLPDPKYSLKSCADGDIATVGDATYQQEIHTAKIDALADILADTDEPIVVFCKFRADIQNIRELLRRRNIKALEISGARNDLTRFKAGESRIVIVQVDAGAEGIDLTMCGERQCHRAVFYSLGFSLSQYEQLRKRLHRPGQKETTYYHHLKCIDTVDYHVYTALNNKQNVVDNIIDLMRTKEGNNG